MSIPPTPPLFLSAHALLGVMRQLLGIYIYISLRLFLALDTALPNAGACEDRKAPVLDGSAERFVYVLDVEPFSVLGELRFAASRR